MFPTLQAKLLAALGGAILLAGLAFGIYWKGREAGKQLGRTEQLSEDQKLQARDRADYEKQMTAAEARNQQAIQLLAQFAASLDRANQRLAEVKSQQQAAAQTVATLPDDAVLSDLRQKLAVTPSATGPLSVPELRKADAMVTELPFAQTQIAALNDKTAALEGKAEALDRQVKAVAAERDAAMQYATQLEGYYTNAYNVAQKARKRPLILKILSFGLLKDPKIELPPPVTLNH